MKSIEVTVREDGLTIKRTTEEPLSAEQKYTLLLALLIAVSALGFFWMMTGH